MGEKDIQQQPIPFTFCLSVFDLSVSCQVFVLAFVFQSLLLAGGFLCVVFESNRVEPKRARERSGRKAVAKVPPLSVLGHCCSFCVLLFFFGVFLRVLSLALCE
jgi:hypothetical protein